MRKLTVKNFSVIKDAELEFGKITVLTGPQASGKSLLCKLAFFFAQVVPEIENDMLTRRNSFDAFRERILQEFFERFPRDAWTGQEFRITYESVQFDIKVEVRETNMPPSVELNSDFAERYNQFIGPAPEEYRTFNAIDPSWIDERVVYGPLRLEHSIYIPTGRAFFSTPNKGFASFSGKNLDWITQRFPTEMDFDYRALIESSGSDQYLPYAFDKEAASILGGRVRLSNGTPHFQLISSDRVLPFDLLSSGTMELLPLLNPLSKRVWRARHPAVPINDIHGFGTIYIEEPESSVFPKTQYQLVRLFAWLASEPALNISLAITTHSPYILTAFNDLIKAGQTAKARPEKTAEIEKIIPKQYWINEGDFAAYAFDGKDGILHPIMDKETGMINGDVLDDVSETISDEFGQLLEIQYGD
jgi:hypothetical protein